LYSSIGVGGAQLTLLRGKTLLPGKNFARKKCEKILRKFVKLGEIRQKFRILIQVILNSQRKFGIFGNSAKIREIMENSAKIRAKIWGNTAIEWINLNNSCTIVGSVALLVARRTNDRKVAGSRPTKVVCITVLTGNSMGVNCPLWPAATTSSEL